MRFILFLLTLSLSTIGYSQVQNSFFSRVDSNAFTSGSKFQLQVDNLNFARNTEYKSKITRGRTLLGYQLQTNLRYRISEKAYVKGGLWLKRDFGGEGFHQIQPLFALHVQLKNTEVVFGNLIGNTDHQLVDQIMNPENVINQRIENGLQVRHKKNRFFYDVWVDWQKMIYPNSPFQEQFVAGYHSSFDLIRKQKIKFTVHTQGIAFHKGGEIDATRTSNVSQYNFNSGFNANLKTKSNSLKSIDIRADFVNYEDQSTEAETFIDGLGQLVSARLNFDKSRIMLSYWDSHQYQSSIGDPVYNSYSKINPSVHTTHYRKMLMARYAYEVAFQDNFSYMGRVQLVHDMNAKTQDVIIEMFFRWRFKHNFEQRSK